jgi:hypothetical protein
VVTGCGGRGAAQHRTSRNTSPHSRPGPCRAKTGRAPAASAPLRRSGAGRATQPGPAKGDSARAREGRLSRREGRLSPGPVQRRSKAQHPPTISEVALLVARTPTPSASRAGSVGGLTDFLYHCQRWMQFQIRSCANILRCDVLFIMEFPGIPNFAGPHALSDNHFCMGWKSCKF